MASPRDASDGTPHDPESRHRRRRIYYGLGKRGSVEKDVYGRFLHDSFSALGEVAVLGLPALLWIVFRSGMDYFGVKNAAVFALPTMVVTIALYRGRLLTPPGCETDGWLRATPSSVLLRFLWYNVVVLVVSSVGGFLGTTGGLGVWSVLPVVGLAAGAVATVPWLAKRVRTDR